MNNEEKILSLLETVVSKVDRLEQKVDNLEQGQAELKQDVTKIKVTLENDVSKNIKILHEGHTALNDKLDDLKDLNEKVINLQTDTSLHKAAIKELARRTAK